MFSYRFLLIVKILESVQESEAFLHDVYILFPMNVIHRKLRSDNVCYW